MVRRIDPGILYDRRIRVSVLVAVGVCAIARGWGYLVPGGGGSTDYIALLVPLIPIEVWAVVWFVSGALMLVGVWMPLVARWAMSSVVALCSAWAVSYFAAWIFRDVSRAWLTGFMFVALAVMAAALTYLMEPADHSAPGRHRRGDE